jgi:hypothetical protein
VGSTDDITSAAPPGTEFIDLRRRTVLPRLHDTLDLLGAGPSPDASPEQIVHDLENRHRATLIEESEQQWSLMAITCSRRYRTANSIRSSWTRSCLRRTVGETHCTGNGFVRVTQDAFIGSNWLITPDPNLLPAQQWMLERGEYSLDLATALRLLTLEGANVVGHGDTRGSIEVGESAAAASSTHGSR